MAEQLRKTPIVNTHVHFPPNFSAFTTVADAVDTAVAEGVRAVGISNFFDQQVYVLFNERAVAAGVLPLFGLEFITLIDELAAAGIRVNDPANPGRMYLTGKGISPFVVKPSIAAATAAAIRSGNDERAAAMVRQLADWFLVNGLDTGLSATMVAATVAGRGEVPVEWVSLQERHIARAFQEVVYTLPEDQREGFLTKVFGGPPTSAAGDAVALQGEIRSRLLKVGKIGFVPEVPLSFQDAYSYVLAMRGIPCYPTLADGVSPVCPFEESPEGLAKALLERGIHAAELIPNRNSSAAVDAYVRAFTDAGLIVVAGTEHNTLERIPFDPQCADGPLSGYARQAFWEGTCVVAAHQRLTADGQPGYVDAEGRLLADTPERRQELVALGATLIKGEANA
jgi:hypothetical protein